MSGVVVLDGIRSEPAAYRFAAPGRVDVGQAQGRRPRAAQ